MLCTNMYCFECQNENKKKPIFVHNMLSTCIFLGIQWTITSYRGLTDSRMKASDTESTVLSKCFFCCLLPCPSIGPKWFWTVQIVLDLSKLFWSCPNRFGRVQIILVRYKLDFSGLFFLLLGTVPNDLDPTKTIGTQPKWFARSKIIWTHRRTRHTWSADYLHERNVSKLKSIFRLNLINNILNWIPLLHAQSSIWPTRQALDGCWPLGSTLHLQSAISIRIFDFDFDFC
jgi:hypothetical protein